MIPQSFPLTPKTSPNLRLPPVPPQTSRRSLSSRTRIWDPNNRFTYAFLRETYPKPNVCAASRYPAAPLAPFPASMTNTVMVKAFSTTRALARDHYFDTLKFVQHLKDEGFSEEQSRAMMLVLSDVIEESIQNLTRTMVLKEGMITYFSPFLLPGLNCFPPSLNTSTLTLSPSIHIPILSQTRIPFPPPPPKLPLIPLPLPDADRSTYSSKVDFTKLRSELLAADSNETTVTLASHERLSNDIAKLASRLRDEVGRAQASVKLDLNLEKGRIREEAKGQELKIRETETRIEQEVAGLRERVEGVKFSTLQWLM